MRKVGGDRWVDGDTTLLSGGHSGLREEVRRRKLCALYWLYKEHMDDSTPTGTHSANIGTSSLGGAQTQVQKVMVTLSSLNIHNRYIRETLNQTIKMQTYQT